MGYGDDEVGAGGVAKPGHETDDLEDEGPVRKDHEPDGDDKSGEAPDEREIEQRAHEEPIDEQTEYHEVGEGDRQDLIMERSVSWRGALPMPKDFNEYPAEVQDKIVEWADRNLAIDEKVIEASTRIDQQDSDRMNDYTKAEIDQTSHALIWTGVLNLALVVGAIVVAVITNNAASVIAIIGGLASINIIPSLTKNQSSRRTSPGNSGASDKKEEPKKGE